MDVIKNLLVQNAQTSILLMEFSADLLALRSVVSRLSPETESDLMEQMVVERDRIRRQIEAQRSMIQAFQSGVSLTPN